MSYSPFDGVLLDDLRPPIQGTMAVALHLQVAESLGISLNQDSINNRVNACNELLEHGLFPPVLRNLSNHSLDLGNPKDPHSINSVICHLEGYLEAVSSLGYIEPNSALWYAVDAELEGKCGMWIERTPKDGPIEATLKDLQPVRLRALTCLPQLGGATFRLATRRGGIASGLFGSRQPLIDWFMEGIEAHGQDFASDIQLAEPEGWGKAPWSGTLDSLFEAPLGLDGHKTCFQRALVRSPWDLISNAVEQIVRWTNQGIAQEDISLVHPEPEKIREFAETILLKEGVSIRSSRSLLPLLLSETWSSIWNFLEGLAQSDPWTMASGLQNSKRPEIRHWAEILATFDQSGQKTFETSIDLVNESSKAKIISVWRLFKDIKKMARHPVEWADALTDLITSQLRFQLFPEDFYPPMGLLRECWSGEFFSEIRLKKKWDFERMLSSLRIFLESARSLKAPVSTNGVRLLAPSELMDEWNGSEATLILDLSEGTWPAKPRANPDMDWARRASINHALLQASKCYHGPFPPALQRFWLPRAEHTEQIPRTFQRDAYAFNKVLAMTSQHIVALSPAQDERGRKIAQGPFWTAIEGAGKWEADTKYCISNHRWAWEGFNRKSLADERSKSVKIMGIDALFSSKAPVDDHIQEIRIALQSQKSHISTTLLESLARCPFRTIAERVWKLGTDDTDNQLQKNVGTVAHRILHTLFEPVLNIPNWAEAFISHYKLPETDTLDDLVGDYWLENKDALIPSEARKSREQFLSLQQQIESLLPNIATYLRYDLGETCPTQDEMGLLQTSQKEGWQRTIIGLEQKLGPITLSVGNEPSVAVAGIVDRIELWENHDNNLSFHRVVDYKTTTKYRLNAYADGNAPFRSHLQMPLYTWMAMEAHNGKATSVLIPLREIEPKPFTKHLKCMYEMNELTNSDTGIEGWRFMLAKSISALDARINNGDFPPTPSDHCQHCKLSALCMRPVDIVEIDEYDDE